jgi:hypothetical protein
LAGFENCRATNQPCFFASSSVFLTAPLACSAAAVRITFAPRMRMSLRRSTENDSGISATNGYPLTAQTIASAMPVLPDVASTTVWPGFSSPRRSASSMIPIASRSFTDESGLNASHLTYMVTFEGARRLIRTTGVLPMVPRMSS